MLQPHRRRAFAAPVSGLLIFGLLLLALPATAHSADRDAAQEAEASTRIAGEVSGPDGIGVGGAEVTLELEGGGTRITTTDDSGAFVFDAAPVGSHQLRVARSGFASVQVAVTAESGAEARISVELAIAFAEAVTVTGQQIERDLQQEPTSVALATGERLDRGTDTDLYRLVAMTPNVNSPADARGFSVRGIDQRGFGADSGLLVSVRVDGATVQSYQGAYFGPFSTWDLDRVEIFRGPQSTQQGRSSLAGAIVMESADPVYRTGVRVRLRGGNLRSSQTAATVNVPLVADRAALRFSVDRQRSDGFIENSTRDESAYDFRDALNLRAKLRFDPSDRFRGMLTLSQTDSRGGDGVIGVDRFPEERVSLADHEAEDGSRHRAATLELEYDIDDRWSLESTSSLYEHDYERSEDLDRSPFPAGVLDYWTDDLWTSQELLLRYAGPGRQRGIVGVYLADLDDELRADAAGPGELAGLPPGFVLTSFFATEEETRNLAAFGEFDLGLGDDWTVTLGARLDSERRETLHRQGLTSDPPLPSFPPDSGAAGPPIESEYRAFLPKAALTHHWTPDISTSIGWQRGYRAGGRSVAVLSQQISDFEPEFTDNYEFALRIAGSDRRWFVNGNLFNTDWSDQQVVRMTELGLPLDTLTVNAGSSTVRGMEAQAGYWIGPGVELYGSLGLLRTRFDDFVDGGLDFTGNEFPHAPRWSWLGGLAFRFSELLSGNVGVASQDSTFSDPDNDPRYRVGGRTLVNARFGARRGGLGLFAYGRNLLDESYLLTAWQSEVPLFGTLGRTGAPRTFGIELDFRY